LVSPTIFHWLLPPGSLFQHSSDEFFDVYIFQFLRVDWFDWKTIGRTFLKVAFLY